GEAKELAKRLEPFYAGGKVSAHAKEIARDTIYGATNELYTAFGQIRQLLKRTYAAEDELGTSETEKAALKKMSAMLSDLYLSSLSEASARTAELQRRNIAGADKDMMRALATQGRADAHFIATLSTFQATNEAMLAMKAQARESDDRATATR